MTANDYGTNIVMLWDLRFSWWWEWWWWCSSGFLRYVDSLVDDSVSEKHTVSIFRAEGADSMFLRNIGTYWQVYTVPKPRSGGGGAQIVCCMSFVVQSLLSSEFLKSKQRHKLKAITLCNARCHNRISRHHGNLAPGGCWALHYRNMLIKSQSTM
jgi:hypothetical protein